MTSLADAAFASKPPEAPAADIDPGDRFGLSASQRRVAIAVLQTQADRIDKVAVFGSRAEGRHRANSDLDLVIHGSATEADCNRLATLFQDSALAISVDVKAYAHITHTPLCAHIDRASALWLERSADGRLTESSEAAVRETLA